MMFLLTFAAFICPAFAAGSLGSGRYQTRFDGVVWDDNSWTLSSTTLDQGHYQSRVSLSNGYFGINLAAIGPFMDVDVQENGDNISGWPLFNRRQSFATIAGFYDSQPTTNGTNFEWLNQYGGESVISGVPHWAGLVIKSGDNYLNAKVPSAQISNFSTALNMKRGLMTWEYDWSPQNSTVFHVLYEMFVHKLHVNQAAVRLTITASKDANVTVIDAFDGDCAVRTSFKNKTFDGTTGTIWTAVSPVGLSNITAYVVSTFKIAQGSSALVQESTSTSANQSSIAQSTIVQLRSNKSNQFVKYVGVASSDAFPDPASVAKTASANGAQTGFDALLTSHANEWATIFPTDSVDSYADPKSGQLPTDPNLLEQHINAVANPFHLLQNTVGLNAISAAQNNSNLDTHSIQVSGLGSDSYAGLVFWDADVWMAPGLVVSHPQAAKQIAKYRQKLLPQAKENIKTAYQSSQNQSQKFSEGGAVYPWTSGRFGNCTGTGPCFDYEYHLNGDIGLQLFNYWVATGDTATWKNNFFPIYDAVAYFYGELLSYNATVNRYQLNNGTDPDEYANFVDTPGFTTALVQVHLRMANDIRQRLGLPANTTWTDRASQLEVPVNEDAKIILEYAAMNGSIEVKQADVVLIDDFLDYDDPYAESNLEYYAGKQSLNGPGMTYGVFSIVASEVSLSGCAEYTYDLYGSQPYVRAPFYQYSEQLLDNYSANGGTHPAFPFLTGMGGANRVAVYGYLGLRTFLDSFDISPNLPPQISYLKYRTLYWQGHPISASSNSTHTTLTRLSGSLPGANSTYATQSIPVTFGHTPNEDALLPPGGSLTVRNRMIGYNATVAGNIAQCKPANSSQDYLPGQFPIAAIDGAISTKWQPAQSNITSSLVIDVGNVGTGLPITGFALDWAQHPPVSFAIDFSATSDLSNATNVYRVANVTISQPYNATAANDIVPYMSNTTTVKLNATVSSTRFIRLSISGNQGDLPSQGATVAEFAVIQQSGSRLVPNTVIQSPS